jgi:hypothetical protein
MTRLNEEGRRQVLVELGRAQATLRRRRGALQTNVTALEAEIAELDRIAAAVATAREILKSEVAVRQAGTQS